MTISIHFKTSNGSEQHGPYQFDPEEYDRLKKDFSGYAENGSPQSGAYKYSFLLDDEEKELLLNFENIVYIG